MTIIIPGKTTCKYCGEPIEKEDHCVIIPNVFGNTLDPFYQYQGVYHAECLEKDAMAIKALEKANQIISGCGDDRVCALTGQKITHHDDYGSTMYLTDDPEDPLFPYSCICFSISAFRSWEKNRWLIEQLRILDSCGKWGGYHLKLLIQKLEFYLNK